MKNEIKPFKKACVVLYFYLFYEYCRKLNKMKNYQSKSSKRQNINSNPKVGVCSIELFLLL